LGIPYRCNRAVKIEANAGSDRNHGGNKNRCVDLPDDVPKPPEKKYEGDVDKPGDGLRHHW
jgi:hypothetical protein